MSMTLMAKAMSIKVGNPTTKLILLKLADNANDDGVAWPSYQHVADQCEVSRRSAMTHVKKLQELGLITVKARKLSADVNQSNLFYLHLDLPVKPPAFLPDGGSENSSLGGGENISLGSEGGSLGGEARSLGGSDRASPRTSHSFEPVIEPIKNNKKSIFDFSCWPAMPSEQTLHDWLAMRKRMKANVNQTVINRFAGQLHLAVAAGVSVDDCLAECVVRNWRGFEFTWMQNAKSADAAGWHKDLGRF
ncbi:helix-turn-helix domain-containing protein [Alishewanella sp. SMS9]|nr:helix-turn-helix domain-containing protein [Alishewanella sp. SMS9]